MRVGGQAVLEEGKRRLLGRLVCDGEASVYVWYQLSIISLFAYYIQQVSSTLEVGPELRVLRLVGVFVNHHEQSIPLCTQSRDEAHDAH